MADRAPALPGELEKQLSKQSKAASDAEAELTRLREAARAAEQQAAKTAMPDALAEENRAPQQEVQKLEGMVRDRTEQLNTMRWQQEMQEQQEQQSSSAVDEKMLVVLNQQLTAAREDNERLVAQLHELEGRLEQPHADGDDLSKIRGVGPKLVSQLVELGYTSFEQIASLSEEELEAEDHPLHAFRGRISKDEWIPQATELCEQAAAG